MGKLIKTNFIPRTAAVLLYLVLLSLWLLSGMSARFTTGANTDDEARTAMFNVTESSSMSHTFALVMKPGESSDNSDNNITVTVKNSSETAVSYTIAFELSGNLPLTVEPTANTLTQDKTGKLIWSGGPELAGDEKSYSFKLNWAGTENSYKYSEGIESITVVITAVQED